MRAVVAASAVLLCGCAATPPPPVTVAVYQTRSDTPVNRMEIQVRNGGQAPVTVQRAQLVSTRLAQFPVWDEPVEIPPGAAVDLKVQLPGAVCDGGDSDEVVLTVDGTQVTLPADDMLGQLAEYQAADCFRQDVTRDGSLRVAAFDDGVLRVAAEGAVDLGEFGTTTLFKPRDASALRKGDTVHLLPNRCDAHALADDKQGTYFPVQVTLPDGRSGRYLLGVDDVTRRALYDYYARECGL